MNLILKFTFLACFLQIQEIVSWPSIFKVIFSNSRFSGRNLPQYQLADAFKDATGNVYFLLHDDKNILLVDHSWYLSLRRALLVRDADSVVLEIQWNWNKMMYLPIAEGDVYRVADAIVLLVNGLVDQGIDPSRIILIGHGYGALICGVVGRKFETVHGTQVGRIVALDPYELFDVMALRFIKLQEYDASVVMVIHTSSIHGAGDAEGTIEFFPNGGRQPGCLIWSKECPHNRAYQYFTSAVALPDFFNGTKCESYQEFKYRNCEDLQVSMGNLETYERGMFFLDTTGEAPFFKSKIIE